MPTNFDAIFRTAQERWQRDEEPVRQQPERSARPTQAPVLVQELRSEIAGALGERAAGLTALLVEAEKLSAALGPVDGTPALAGEERLAARLRLAQILDDIEDILEALLFHGNLT